MAGEKVADIEANEGDLLIVRQQPVAESGDIVVALLYEEATVKRLFIREARIELRPANPKYKPVMIGPDDDLRICGKVVAVKRTAH
ncbi:MAG: S24 family peptidase [Thermodesulfobacteriota bacterium]